MKLGCYIKLGDIVEAIITIITLGNGKSIAMYIAKNVFGKDSCGCEERRIFLNQLTCKEEDGIKI